jgi:hypothetical protein
MIGRGRLLKRREPKHAEAQGWRRPLPRLVATVGVALLLSGSAGCGGAASDHRRPAPQQATTAEIGNLRMSVPPLWSVRRLEDRCARSGTGVLISNLDQVALRALRRDIHGLPPGSCTNGWDLTTVPAAFELLDVSEFRWPDKVPETHFPVSEKFFLPSLYESQPGYGCHCSFRSNAISYGRHTYNVRIWVGDGALDSDQQGIACVIASIRPNTGTGASRDCGSGG